MPASILHQRWNATKVRWGIPEARSGKDQNRTKDAVSTWKTLLLIYDRVDVIFVNGEQQRIRFENTLSEEEVRDGIESFRHFPGLVATLTSGAAKIEYDVVHAKQPLTTVSQIREKEFWPSPNDTRRELGQIVPSEACHSILVYWPQHNFQTRPSVPSQAWGWGMGPAGWSFDATYATVANAAAWRWQTPMAGEVWLHEWLHGACAYFAARGHRMPERDADGGGLHGYVQSPTSGWTDYYRDLMTCNVSEGDKLLGISLDAWRTERITTFRGTPWKVN